MLTLDQDLHILQHVYVCIQYAPLVIHILPLCVVSGHKGPSANEY